MTESIESRSGYDYMNDTNSPNNSPVTQYNEDTEAWSDIYSDTVAGKVSQIFSCTVDDVDFKILILYHSSSMKVEADFL